MPLTFCMGMQKNIPEKYKPIPKLFELFFLFIVYWSRLITANITDDFFIINISGRDTIRAHDRWSQDELP